ncbi:hypothetical protein B566_EDAN015016 [Ephemera danica]|nr:hypothetical protein B566_EDAN015016 [Ephemera danica]
MFFCCAKRMHRGHHFHPGNMRQPPHHQPPSHHHMHAHQPDGSQFSNYSHFPPPQQQIFPHLTPVDPPPLLGSALQPPQWSAFQQPNFKTRGSPMHSRPFRGRNKPYGFKKETSNFNKSKSQPAKVKILCEVCDRSFPGDAELAEHLALHEVCGIDGCQFSAHPKVVAKHVEAQHDTGLFEKLILGTAPEEVARWREEQRGERITKPKGRFNNKRNQWKQSPHLPSQKTFQNNRNFKVESKPVEPIRKHETIKKEEDDISTPKLPSALATLVANYGDSGSDDSSDEAPEQTAISREVVGPLPPEKKIRTEQATHRKVQPIMQTVREKYVVHRRPPTLLQKLLEKEIRHERNVILQCVRHAVQNNFFQ